MKLRNRPRKLTPARRRVLLELANHVSLTVMEIAHATGAHPFALVRVCDDLVRKGLAGWTVRLGTRLSHRLRILKAGRERLLQDAQR